jgi:hypothetical protein
MRPGAPAGSSRFGISTIAGSILRAEPPGDAEHARHAEAPDVGVEHADRSTLRRERDREVHGDRRLADTALAARDREDARHRADLGLGSPLGGLEAGALHDGRALGLRHLRVLDLDVAHAGQAVDLRDHVGLDLAPQRAARRRERHLHPHVAVGGDLDVPQHPEVDDARTELGIAHPGEDAPHRRDVGRLRRGHAFHRSVGARELLHPRSAGWPSGCGQLNTARLKICPVAGSVKPAWTPWQ